MNDPDCQWDSNFGTFFQQDHWLIWFEKLWLLLLQQVPEEIYRVLEGQNELESDESNVPESLEEFVAEMRSNISDAKTFAVKLKAMVCEKTN